MQRDWSDSREELERDGVAYLPAALHAADLARCRAAYEWSLANPSPQASSDRGDSGVFRQDLCNENASAAYAPLLAEVNVGEIAASLWGAGDVWFMYEQVFLKEGSSSRRTPWHQDASYLAVDGDHLVVFWISFEAVAREDSLEFVRGSHRGVLYDGSLFDPRDDTAPLYGTGELPRLPAIEADRDAWDIVSWATEPGDIVAFHHRTLHGGAPTRGGKRRRTLSLRFFGPDAVYRKRPGPAGPVVKGLHRSLEEGAPFRHPAFQKMGPPERE